MAEAAERMTRTGHEGYPVVRDGRVVGLLTRRAVDRAMQHGMGNRPVERVMDQGEVFVTPDDPVEKLEQLMIEHGWGQVPVVEDGQVTGIVTRTDLIKLWAKPPSTPRRAQVAAKLEAALPAPLLALIRDIAATAHEMGLSVYFVGGIVRDLLLGFPDRRRGPGRGRRCDCAGEAVGARARRARQEPRAVRHGQMGDRELRVADDDGESARRRR